MAENIFIILPILLLMILLIIQIINPRGMINFGHSIFYKEEPEPTEGYINFSRSVSIVALLFMLTFLFKIFSNRLALISLIVTLIVIFYMFVVKNRVGGN